MREGSSVLTKYNLKREYQNYKFEEGQRMIEYSSGLNLIITKLKTDGVSLEHDDVIVKILTDLPRRFENFKETCQTYRLTMESLEDPSPTNFRKMWANTESYQGQKEVTNKEDAFLLKRTNVCENYGKKGHRKINCWKRSPTQKRRKRQLIAKNSLASDVRERDTSRKTAMKDQQKPKKNAMIAGRNIITEMGNKWIADGGATCHVTANSGLFREYERLTKPMAITVATDETIYAFGCGLVDCLVHDGNERNKITLNEVCHVSKLGSTNLLSLSKLADEGMGITQTENQYIGLEIDRNNEGITICREKYVEKILD
jgi:hypothetical protein